MSKFGPRRFNDDVVTNRRKVKPKSTPTGKYKAKKSLAKKETPFKSGQNIKVNATPSISSDNKKPVKRCQSTQDKRELIDPEIYSAIIRQIDASLPEPPFKVGINKELFERLVNSCDVSKRKLRRVLNSHIKFITNRKSYLEAAMKASHRHGLDGSKTEMTEEHRKVAEIRLKHIKIKQNKSSDRTNKSNGRK
jgi:hypothetical protein